MRVGQRPLLSFHPPVSKKMYLLSTDICSTVQCTVGHIRSTFNGAERIFGTVPN